MTGNDYGKRSWRYRNRESGYEFTNRLHLEPEIERSPMVGDLHADNGAEQLAAFARYAEGRMTKYGTSQSHSGANLDRAVRVVCLPIPC